MPGQVLLIAERSGILRQTIPTQMIEDLLTIADVPTEAITRLADALEQEPGFPTTDRLAEIIQSVIAESSQVSAVLAALLNLRRDQVEPVLWQLEEWRTINPKNAERMPEHAFSAIKERLAQLIRDYAVLERRRKARRLMTFTGNTMESIDILCDIRPVFDKDRKKVEGLIPLVTLKLAYQVSNEENKVLEVLLSNDMLDQLLDAATKAKQKQDVLRECLTDWLPGGWIENE